MGKNHLDHLGQQEFHLDKDRQGHRELWGKEEGRDRKLVEVVAHLQMVQGILLDMVGDTGEDMEEDMEVGKVADKDSIGL